MGPIRLGAERRLDCHVGTLTGFFLLIVVLFGPLAMIRAQSTGTPVVVTGTVEDQLTRKRIPNATVSATGDLFSDITTDGEGKFTYTFDLDELPPNITIRIDKFGYDPWFRNIPVSRVLTIDAFLVPSKNVVPAALHPLADHSLITISYMRLIGALQATLILKTMFEDTFATAFGDDPGESGQRSIDIVKPTTQQLYQFWKTWEYRSARPLLSPTWQQLFPIGETGVGSGVALLKEATKDEDFKMQWKMFHGRECPITTGAGANDMFCEGGKYTRETLVDIVPTESNKLGFLCLMIHNSSPMPLRDVRIDYRVQVKRDIARPYMPANAVDEELDPAVKRDPARHDLLENYGPNHGALTLDQFLPASHGQDDVVTETKVVDEMPGNGTFLWLVSAYVRDSSGYPLEYIATVSQPVAISYKLRPGGSIHRGLVRRPLYDKAAKIPLPFGWSHQ